MKALILSAGLGTRLGLKNIPKTMYTINEKPILEHNILLLKKHNITDICINLHYMPEIIKEYFGDGRKWQVKIQYSFEKELLGTSGAVKNIEWFWGKEPFFVIYGDNYTSIDLTQMFKFHKFSMPIATITIFDPKKTVNCNIAGGHITIDQNNNIISFIEGGGNNVIGGYVNAGVYILDHKILDMIPKETFSDFGKDIFPKLLNKGVLLKGYLTDGFVIAIDTKEALSIANQVSKQGGMINDNN